MSCWEWALRLCVLCLEADRVLHTPEVHRLIGCWQVWKVRKAAYEDAAKQFEVTPDEHDPAFRPFLNDPGLWKGAVADSNVAAQQDGIAALCAFLKFGGRENCTRSVIECGGI
jgi:hypothetical protein